MALRVGAGFYLLGRGGIRVWTCGVSQNSVSLETRLLGQLGDYLRISGKGGKGFLENRCPVFSEFYRAGSLWGEPDLEESQITVRHLLRHSSIRLQTAPCR